MLTKEKLQELNTRMVLGGEPDSRDNIGYNKVHFYMMRALSHIPIEHDLQAYAIASVLSFYKNTQLSDYKTEIEETLKHYQSALPKIEKDKFDTDKSYFKYADQKYRREHGIRDEIKIVSFTNREVIVHYDGYVDGVRDWIYEQDKSSAHWVNNNGVWNIGLSWDKVPAFLDYMRDKGKYGYDSDELRDMCEHLEDFIDMDAKIDVAVELCELNDLDRKLLFGAAAKDPKYAIITLSENSGVTRDTVFSHRDIFERIQYKPNPVDYTGEKIYCLVDADNLNKITKCEPTGYRFVLSDKIKQYGDILARLELEKANARKGQYTLLDLSKLSLPFKPYPFQIEDATEALKDKRHALLHDMGCGKTFISAIMGESIPKPKLVICPESLRLNWRREIRNVNPNADIVNLYSNKEFKMGRDWTICGYSTAVKFLPELLKAGAPVMFIDEAHFCKSVDNFGNPTSQRGQAVLALADKAEYVYPLTGTPIPTSNRDAYNLLKILKSPHIDNDSFYNYGMHYCAGYNNGYGYDFSGNSNGEELRDILMENATRRTKAEVLPDLTKQRVFVPIEANSTKCDKIVEEMKKCDTSNFLGYAQTIRRLLSGIKIKAALDLSDVLLSGNEKVVIVSEFRDTIDKIEKTYGDKCCTIEGGMSDKAKQQAIDDFQTGDKRVCALNLQAGGVGITLTAASHMIICDYDWTPANMIQVEDRICRAGQTKPCMIHYIYAEDMDIDRLFVQMISEKSANSDFIVDGNEKGNLNLITALREQYKTEKDEKEEEFEKD